MTNTHTFIYEFPHDDIHRLEGVEVSPNVYVVSILDISVRIECTPSKKAFSVSFSTSDDPPWIESGADIDGLLRMAHEAIVEETKRAANPLKLKLKGRDLVFVSDPSYRHVISWKYNDEHLNLYVVHSYDEYHVHSEWKAMSPRYPLSARGEGSTAQEALDNWEKRMDYELAKTVTAAQMMKQFLTPG